MTSFRSLLPPPKSTTTTTSFHDHSNAPWFKNRFTEPSSASVASKAAPPYLKRQGNPEDFGDGGAFPELHVVQYPLGMGKNKSSFCIQKQENNNDKPNKHELHKQTITEETKAAMDKIMNVGLRASQGSKYINYEPSSGAKERIVRMVETPVVPLVPPKFKHKRIPKPSSDSPPVPVVHSPPRPVTVKDQRDWKIPPCVSNWNNPKGYVIPLEKRCAADGRGLQEVRISDGFAKLSEAMCVAEEKAREAVWMRGKVRREVAVVEKERREEELRGFAQRARSEGAGVEEGEERMQRERRLGKERKIGRDRERDVSERVALGIATTGGKGGEVVYDQRLFNQEKGLGSGLGSDDDDQYNVYENGLFTAQATLSMMYKPRKDRDEEMYGNADEELDKVKNTERFKPVKGFTGAASVRSGKRERLVEFEREDEEDVFGLGRFESDVKRGKKALDQIGSGGSMRASGGGGGSSREDYGGSGRTKINFERGGRLKF